MTESREPAWPPSRDVLTDPHRCPSCFSPLRSTTCEVCGLDLSDPRATELLNLGRLIVSTDDKRRALLADLRAAQDAALLAQSPPFAAREPRGDANPAIAPFPVGANGPLRAEVPAFPGAQEERTEAPDLTATPVPVPSAPAPSPPPRRRLSVPVLLLFVGVSLVGIAAIFFLTLAWFVAGIEVRALIVGGVTLAAIATATLLRRKALTATAEGIAALGVILLGLDAWAVRANDLLGAGSTRGVVYFGAATLLLAVIFRGWAYASRLRVPDLASAVALPVGAALLVAGVSGLSADRSLLVGLLAASAAGVVFALGAPWSSARTDTDAVVERTLLAAIGTGALVLAWLQSFATAPSDPWVPLWSALAIVSLSVVYVRLFSRDASLAAAPMLSEAVAVFTVIVASTAAWHSIIRSPLPAELGQVLPPVLAVAVSVATDRLRFTSRRFRLARTVAAIIAAVSVVVAALWWLTQTAVSSAGWVRWLTPAFGDAAAPGSITVVVGSVLLVGLVAWSPRLDAHAWTRPVIGAVLLIGAVGRIGQPGPLILLGAVLVAVGLATCLARGVTVGWVAATALGGATSYLAGIASAQWWALGIVAAVGCALGLAVALRTYPRVAASVSVLAVGVAVLTAIILPDALAWGAPLDPAIAAQWRDHYDLGAAAALVQWLSLLVLIVAALTPVARLTRRALGVTGAVIAAGPLLVPVTALYGATLPGASSAPTLAHALGEPVAGTVRLLAICVVVAAVAAGRTKLRSRGIAALLAPVAAGAAVIVATIAGTEHVAGVVSIAVAALTVILAVWLAPHYRLAVESGAAAVFVVSGLAIPLEQHSVALALLSAATFAASVGPAWAAPRTARLAGVPTTARDGALTVAAVRRVLMWPALSLGAVAWWAVPAVARSTVEVAVIPPALVFLAWALVLTWLRRTGEGAAAIGIGFAFGLGVPAVQAALGDPEPRGPIVAVVASTIALLCVWSPLRHAAPVAATGSAVSLSALGMVVIGRGWRESDAWAALALIFIGALVGWGAARMRTTAARVLAEAAVPAVLLVGVTAVAPALAARTTTHASTIVVVGVVVAAAAHLAAARLRTAPFSPLTRAASVLAIILLTTAALAGGIYPEWEFATLPLAVLLLAGVAVALPTTPDNAVPAERVLWFAGLVLAVAPSALGAPTDLRMWLTTSVVLVAAVLALWLAPRRGSATLPTVALLTGAALVVAIRATTFAAPPRASLAYLVAAATVVVALVAVTRFGIRAQRTACVLTASAAGVAIFTSLTVPQTTVAGVAVITLVSGAIGVAAASFLARAPWSEVTAILTLGATALVVTTTITQALRSRALAWESEFWVTAGALIVATACLAAARAAGREVRVRTAVGIALGATVFVWACVMAWRFGSGGFLEVRVAITVLVVSVAGATGYLGARRWGIGPAVGAAGAVIIVVTAGVAQGVRPIELLTAPVALALLAVGLVRLRDRPEMRTWPALGPGLALLTVPSLLLDVGATSLWRVVTLGLVAIALVVIGALRRWQAPIVLGSVVLLIHAVAQLWPWIALTYESLPWWLWLGVGGIILIVLGARYERQMRALRSAFAAVTSLR